MQALFLQGFTVGFDDPERLACVEESAGAGEHVHFATFYVNLYHNGKDKRFKDRVDSRFVISIVAADKTLRAGEFLGENWIIQCEILFQELKCVVARLECGHSLDARTRRKVQTVPTVIGAYINSGPSQAG